MKTARRTVLDQQTCPNLHTNIELIASNLPGWGAAFRELREQVSLSQESLAQGLGLNKTVVSHWEHERHRPALDVLQKALIFMRVDVRILRKYFPNTDGLLKGAAMYSDERSAALKVSEILAANPDATPEELERLLHEQLDREILIRQAIKALSGDTKSAALFMERGQQIRKDKFKSPLALARNFSHVFDSFVQTEREEPDV